MAHFLRLKHVSILVLRSRKHKKMRKKLQGQRLKRWWVIFAEHESTQCSLDSVLAD